MDALKLKKLQVKQLLKELEVIVFDHIEDGGELDISALNLVKSALEMHEIYMDEESEAAESLGLGS